MRCRSAVAATNAFVLVYPVCQGGALAKRDLAVALSCTLPPNWRCRRGLVDVGQLDGGADGGGNRHAWLGRDWR